MSVLSVAVAAPAHAADPPPAPAPAPASLDAATDDASARARAAKVDPAKADPAKADPAEAAADADEEAAERRRHGSRSEAGDGSLLLWDNVTGVFVSADVKNTFWIGERFYQHKDGIWLTSRALAGPWEMIEAALVPDRPRGRFAPPKTSVTATLPSGVQAVYEPRLKAFRVAGHRGVFLFDARFYRFHDGVWLGSGTADGPWLPTSAKPLPPILRRTVPLPGAGHKVTLPDGVTLVFEAESSLFAVEGQPDAVFFDGTYYYARREGKWMAARGNLTDFQEVSPTKVPGPVRTNYHRAKDGKTKTKAKSKAKSRSRTRPSKKGAPAAQPAGP